MADIFAFLRDEEAAHAGAGKKGRMRGTGHRETAGKSWGMSEGGPRAMPPCGSRAQNDLLPSGNEGLAGKLVHQRFDREELVDP
jgi:hypothetical protein